jgi:hypothetical protein
MRLRCASRGLARRAVAPRAREPGSHLRGGSHGHGQADKMRCWGWLATPALQDERKRKRKDYAPTSRGDILQPRRVTPHACPPTLFLWGGPRQVHPLGNRAVPACDSLHLPPPPRQVPESVLLAASVAARASEQPACEAREANCFASGHASALHGRCPRRCRPGRRRRAATGKQGRERLSPRPIPPGGSAALPPMLPGGNAAAALGWPATHAFGPGSAALATSAASQRRCRAGGEDAI